MPTSYRVVPDSDGKGWKVMAAKGNSRNHSTVSKHRKKSAAKRKARRLADSGDRLVILRADGSIMSNNEVRG
jgi:hypothetical protein